MIHFIWFVKHYVFYNVLWNICFPCWIFFNILYNDTLGIMVWTVVKTQLNCIYKEIQSPSGLLLFHKVPASWWGHFSTGDNCFYSTQISSPAGNSQNIYELMSCYKCNSCHPFEKSHFTSKYQYTYMYLCIFMRAVRVNAIMC